MRAAKCAHPSAGTGSMNRSSTWQMPASPRTEPWAEPRIVIPGGWRSMEASSSRM